MSPELTAAREAVTAARARERQAAAIPNPTLAYSLEQASGGNQATSQHIAVLEQPIELGGIRSARRDAARHRREAAEARLTAAAAQLDFDVTRAFARALAAERRAALAGQAADAFSRARGVSGERLAAGDISGYANRRLRLESARYAALRAEAELERRAARIGLASLIVGSADSVSAEAAMVLALDDSEQAPTITASADSLVAVALAARAELRAAEREHAAAQAEARLVSRERVPVPVLSAGIKSESISGTDDRLNGLAAGISIPLPLWDRRRGAVQAAEAEARIREATSETLRRRVAREVVEALDAWRAAQQQLDALAPQLGTESATALRAAQVAYAEGEIPLVEWLDAVRAYQEAEASFASVRAEVLIRYAALERAVGAPIPSTSSAGGASAAPKE